MRSTGKGRRRPSVRRSAAGADASHALALGAVVFAAFLVLAFAGVLVTCAQQPDSGSGADASGANADEQAVLDARDESETLEGDDDDDAADEEIVSQYLFDHGYDPAHVAAIMGNIRQESGFEPQACDGKYYGLFMISGDRFNALYSYAEAKGTSWGDTRTQIEFAVSEMTGGGDAADYAPALNLYLDGRDTVSDAFVAYADVDSATEYFALAYERCVGGSDYSSIASSLTGGRYSTLQQLSKRQSFAESYLEGFSEGA